MPGALHDSLSPFLPLSWVPRFRSRTTKTRFITISPSNLQSLLTGTITTATSSTTVEWSDGSTSDVTSQPSAYPHLEASINASIDELGGAVVPKFDRNCPTDAVWVNFHRSLKCTSADDVLIMLSSSERVMTDLTAESGCLLALRKWADMDERMEFRVFVRDEHVVAISQRSENFFEYQQHEMDSIVDKILVFYDQHVKSSFHDSFVMDVYIQRECVWIIDFDAWASGDALLFTWEQLNNAPWMSTDRPQFRCALRCGVNPSRTLLDGLPIELRTEGTVEELISTARHFTADQTKSISDSDSSDGGNEQDLDS